MESITVRGLPPKPEAAVEELRRRLPEFRLGMALPLPGEDGLTLTVSTGMQEYVGVVRPRRSVVVFTLR